MAFVTHRGARIYYETHGSGEPLVLVMGLGGHGRTWALQVAAFSPHYRVVTVDNRGAGRSDAPDEPYDTPLFADDLRAVLDELALERVHLLGASMGGLIAQEFYHRYPGRVRSLMLACTGVGANDPANIDPEPEAVAALTLDRRRETPRRIMEALVDTFYHPSMLERVPDLVDRALLQQAALPQAPHAYERQLYACFNHAPYSPRLVAIAVPTLVLHGAEDRIWPLANGEYLARHIAGAELAVLADCGHMLMIERPQAFNEAVLAFLERP